MVSTKRELLLFRDKMSYYNIKLEQYKKMELSDEKPLSVLVHMKDELEGLLNEAEQLRKQRETVFKEMPSPYNTLMYNYYIVGTAIGELAEEYGYSEQHLRRLINDGIKMYESGRTYQEIHNPEGMKL